MDELIKSTEELLKAVESFQEHALRIPMSSSLGQKFLANYLNEEDGEARYSRSSYILYFDFPAQTIFAARRPHE